MRRGSFTAVPRRRILVAAVLVAVCAAAPGALAAGSAKRAAGPQLARPAVSATLVSSRVRFAWAHPATHARSQLRLSRNRRFHLVDDVTVGGAASTRILADGTWFWKVRTLAPHVSAWSSTRSLTIHARRDIIAPTRPLAPHVTATTATTITLAFGRSRDAFGVTRYDILSSAQGRARSLATHVAGTATRATVQLACASAEQSLYVRARDRAGNVSQISPVAHGKTKACGAATGAPSAPTGLRVATQDERSVTLAWSPSTARSGSIASYIVTRDATTVGSSHSTDFTATGLSGATTYIFSVQAKDSAGHLSDPALLQVGTDRPAQTTGRLHAHLLASDGASYADFQAHASQIGWVYTTDYEVVTDASGDPQITGSYSAAIARWAQLRGIKVLPRFHSENTAVLHAVLADPTNRAQLVAEVAALVARDGADGANIDFEAGYCPAANDCDRDALTSFVQGLAAAMHAQGRLLSVDVSASTVATTSGRAAFYDYAAIGAAADEEMVMAWNPHYSTSMPGPIANALRDCGGLPCAWTTQVMAFTSALVPAAKLTFATGLYGLDWSYTRQQPGGPVLQTPVDLRILPGSRLLGNGTTIVTPGQTLTSVPGVWTGTDGSLPTDTWQLCPSFRLDATCTQIGQGPSYTVQAADVSLTQPYLFLVEEARNTVASSVSVAGLRTSVTTFRPSANGEYCITHTPSGTISLAQARPVTDATGVLGTVVAPGNACLAAPALAREFSNDIPQDDPVVSSPIHVGVSQVLARLAAAGVAVAQGIDPLSGEGVADWVDPATGLEHQMWWPDAASAAGDLAAFTQAGYGMGIWRLGREDSALWTQPALR